MIANNDIGKYKSLVKLSVLDYLTFIEGINSNFLKAKDGQH